MVNLQNLKLREKKPKRNFLRFLKWFAIALISLLLIGFIYEQIAEFLDSKNLKAPGQMIQVGDHKMHIYCTGENKNGSPTVILISGAEQPYSTWSRVQPELAKNTKVCSYDRFGIGFSESTDAPRTNTIVANELHDLLQNANIPGPYILAGHSIGGFYERVFTDLYPKEVKGMVLVDSSLDQENNPNVGLWAKVKIWLARTYFRTAPYIGITRLVMPINPEYIFGVAKEDNIGRFFRSEPFKEMYRNKYEETYDFDSLTTAESFGSLPVRVIYSRLSAKNMDPYLNNQAAEYHKTQTRFSTNVKIQKVKDSGHFIQIDQPQVVIDMISKMVAQETSK